MEEREERNERREWMRGCCQEWVLEGFAGSEGCGRESRGQSHRSCRPWMRHWSETGDQREARRLDGMAWIPGIREKMKNSNKIFF